jgi:predicted HAD superfamily phosphohydrolase
LTKRFLIAFDVEGPIINPNFDFAWLTLENFVKKSDLQKLYEKVKVFDEYDDKRWLHERTMEGHSTGATPIVASLLSIACGAKNDTLLDLAKKHLKFTPGATRLVKWLRDEKQVQPYLISSAHPAAILPVAYELQILSSHVFCNGYQLTQKKSEGFDKLRETKRSSSEQVMLKETNERFPYDEYSGSRTLYGFIDNYLDVCGKMNKLYTASEVDEHTLESFKAEQEQLLGKLKSEGEKLAEDLWYLLYSEVGLMGAHRKKLALMEIERRENVGKENLIYVGDSIVDADAFAYAGHGISINCTNREALLSSEMNVATPTLCSLTVLIEFITSNQNLTIQSKDILQKKMNEEISAEEGAVPQARVFSTKEINNNTDAVTQANRLCKDYIKRIKSNNVF